MSGSREVGRYNLHRLGWSAFEDLCMQVMKTVLGETCTRFPAGRDGGRDGWFRGTPSGKLKTENELEGTFIVQCKHTSQPHHPLAVTGLKEELGKVRKLAANGPCNYLLMTNRHVTSLADAEFCKQFESIQGVARCLVLSEIWIEDAIDANPRLLRLVPRLYGIGDLTQILSYGLEKQTIAVLEEYAHTLRTFVPTDSYRRAESTLSSHRFAVLVGPPASGKSAIASNLCMVNSAQDRSTRVLRIEHVDQFKQTWSPEDRDTIYWVDDVFGETTLDEFRLREWSAALEKVEAARKRGARIIFCTRDYILAAARGKLKRSKSEILDDAKVQVIVTNLSSEERTKILYNHIKHGDVPTEFKREIKPILPMVADLPSFSPELARRLGSKRFTAGLETTKKAVKAFFDNPVDHFRDVLHGLAAAETMSLTVCLYNDNAVPDPIPAAAVPDRILKEHGLTVSQIREAFDQLNGSLVKKVRVDMAQVWQVHHPSMIEALQFELAAKSSQLELYIESAKLDSILRDTTCRSGGSDGGRLLFLPNGIYPQLISRLATATGKWERVGQYLIDRSTDELLKSLVDGHPTVITEVLRLTPTPVEPDTAARMAVRLSQALPASLLQDGWLKIGVDGIIRGMGESGWFGCIEVDGFERLISAHLKQIVEQDAAKHFASFDRLYDWHVDDIRSPDDCGVAIEVIEEHAARMRECAVRYGVLKVGEDDGINDQQQHYKGILEGMRSELERAEEARADMYEDEWRERWHEERFETEHGPFRDVDE